MAPGEALPRGHQAAQAFRVVADAGCSVPGLAGQGGGRHRRGHRGWRGRSVRSVGAPVRDRARPSGRPDRRRRARPVSAYAPTRMQRAAPPAPDHGGDAPGRVQRAQIGQQGAGLGQRGLGRRGQEGQVRPVRAPVRQFQRQPGQIGDGDFGGARQGSAPPRAPTCDSRCRRDLVCAAGAVRPRRG